MIYLFWFFLIPVLGMGQDFTENAHKVFDDGDFVQYAQNEQDTLSLVYENPQLEIVAQNKELLGFSLIWDEDVVLNLAVVSIIGNTFYTEEITYQGVPLDVAIDISDYPTGIFLLKVSDDKEKVLLRKFTKY